MSWCLTNLKFLKKRRRKIPGNTLFKSSQSKKMILKSYFLIMTLRETISKPLFKFQLLITLLYWAIEAKFGLLKGKTSSNLTKTKSKSCTIMYQ